MLEPIIVIPTYWSKGKITHQDIIYDHPTNLENPEETISRTLQSFTGLSGKFKVLVIGAPTRPSIGLEMDQKLKDLIKSINLPYSVYYFGFENYQKLISICNTVLPPSLVKTKLISNRGYGNIRNLCLLIPHLMGYSIVILIDDDELIADPDFISKATEHIGKFDTKSNKIIGLICGFYKNLAGSIYLDENQTKWWEVTAWNKLKLMNETFQQLEAISKPQLIDTPLTFGGNMVITKECWLKVPFDPLIRRGEDMDYLRNAKHAGFLAKLDKTLSIIHRPPTSTVSYSHKFKQDIYRFLYAKYKMISLGIDPEDYKPYPGYFLEKTEAKVLLTELLEKLQNFPSIFTKALTFAKEHAQSYLHFQSQWQILLNSLVIENSFGLLVKILYTRK